MGVKCPKCKSLLETVMSIGFMSCGKCTNPECDYTWNTAQEMIDFGQLNPNDKPLKEAEAYGFYGNGYKEQS